MAQMPTLEEAKAAVARATYRADIFFHPRDIGELIEKIDRDLPDGAVDPAWEKILAPTRPSLWAKDRIHLIVLGRAWKGYELEEWIAREFHRRQKDDQRVLAEAQRTLRKYEQQQRDKRDSARNREREELAAESIAEGYGDATPTCSLTPTAPPWMLSAPGTFRQFSDMEPLNFQPSPDDWVFSGKRHTRWMAKKGRRLGRLYGPTRRLTTNKLRDQERVKT